MSYHPVPSCIWGLFYTCIYINIIISTYSTSILLGYILLLFINPFDLQFLYFLYINNLYVTFIFIYRISLLSENKTTWPGFYRLETQELEINANMRFKRFLDNKEDTYNKLNDSWRYK